MHPFRIAPADDAPAGAADAGAADAAPNAMVIAGGTDMVQLLRNGVLRPDTLRSIDVTAARTISTDAHGALRLPAIATMSEVGSHPLVRAGWPAIADALLAAASPQIRNLGTVGGNLLQRTRCPYFRDTAFACNKRQAGSGCPAISGRNRELAILGASDHCVATHPSDMPVPMVAFDATVETDRGRSIELAAFYRLWGDTPWIENELQPGELITAIVVPASEAARRSAYVKVRDRQSNAYALASIAAGAEIRNGVITDIRLAAGGVGAKPWRLPAVEAALKGRAATPDNIRAASALAADGTRAQSENAFKIKLLVNVTRRAIETVTA